MRSAVCLFLPFPFSACLLPYINDLEETWLQLPRSQCPATGKHTQTRPHTMASSHGKAQAWGHSCQMGQAGKEAVRRKRAR